MNCAARREQVGWRRDARIAGRGVARPCERIGDERVDRRLGVREAVHERRVRAVLEQAAHEIRQQVLLPADGGIHTAAKVPAGTCQ